MTDANDQCTIAIVGGGTAGLALATELKRLGVEDVVILEREKQAGGAPRHCGHHGFGLFEMKRSLRGPDYARRLIKKALLAGVVIRTQTTVTALQPNALLSLSTSSGASLLQAKRVVLCTGVRESSRAQRFIGGQRPLGVMTTGALQSMVYLHGQRPFSNPVILGSELVSMSAIMTCRHLKIKPGAMIEENDRITVQQVMRPFPAIMGVPINFGAQNLRILGDRIVEAVEYTDRNGQRQTIKTDGVIVSGKFRPEAALLHASHLEVDPHTGGPVVDQYGRTCDPSYFSTGNLLRPVESSSWCWREAVQSAGCIVEDLAQPLCERPSIPLRATDPAIRYIMPQRLVISDTPGAMANMQLRLAKPISGPLQISANGKTLWEKNIKSRPERRILVPLEPALKAGLTAPVELSIKEQNSTNQSSK